MSALTFWLELLFPSRCLSCGIYLKNAQTHRALCDSCLTKTPLHQTLLCITCRARLAYGKRICHANTPLRLAAMSRYREPAISAIISRLKYRRHLPALNAIDALMERYFTNLSYDLRGYIVIPIPLHRTRERRRGFNQSLLIAKRLAQRYHLPLITDELLKVRATPPQAKTKNILERRANLKNCFSLQNKTKLTGEKIILVDDVCTSGTTLKEAAETLKKAGAREIIGFTIGQTG